MKKSLMVLPIIIFLLLMMVSFARHTSSARKKQQPAKNSIVLVELFTSEGCSSCPPADAALAELTKDYPDNVFVLAFHVEYWNYLGWKDEFSNTAFTSRQQHYAESFQLNSIYTPQAIVNGKIQFTGSDKSQLYSTVEKELAASHPLVINLSAKAGTHKNSIDVTYKTSADNEDNVCLALLQLHASSAVKRGENKGMFLQHVNVVRDFTSSSKNAGTANLQMPEGLLTKDCKVVAFVQNRRNLHISGAAAAIIQ